LKLNINQPICWHVVQPQVENSFHFWQENIYLTTKKKENIYLDSLIFAQHSSVLDLITFKHNPIKIFSNMIVNFWTLETKLWGVQYFIQTDQCLFDHTGQNIKLNNLYTYKNLQCKTYKYLELMKQSVVTAENEGEKFRDEFRMKIYIQNLFLNFSPSILWEYQADSKSSCVIHCLQQHKTKGN